MAVDLYSGLKGQRLRPSSVTISPVSLLTREKSAVFWRTQTHIKWKIRAVTWSGSQHRLSVPQWRGSQSVCLWVKHRPSLCVCCELFYKRSVEKDCNLGRFLYNLITCIKYFDPFPFGTGDDKIMHMQYIVSSWTWASARLLSELRGRKQQASDFRCSSSRI